MEASKFQFCTAVLGEQYRGVGEALIRSFNGNHSPELLHVFTDLDMPAAATSHANLSALISGLPRYYQDRPRVFKFQLLRDMFEMYPEKEIVWIDADAVVLGPLPPHLRAGHVNVMALSRDDLRAEHIGNNCVVPAREYVTSNFFSLPSVLCLEQLERLMDERLRWPDADDLTDEDQILVNHLVHYGDFPVNWVGGEGDGWFSTGCAVSLQDRRLHHHVKAGPKGTGITFRGEPIILYSPTKLLVELSMLNGFSSYPAALRERLRAEYQWYELPVGRRLLGFIRRALIWDLPRWVRRRARMNRIAHRLVVTLRRAAVMRRGPREP